jgi:hypothetical protein
VSESPLRTPGAAGAERRCAGAGSRLGAGAAIAVTSLLVACGGVKASDLFLVERSGSGPGAHLTVLVNEEGGVRCNGGPTLKLSDPQLVEARAIQEDMREPASKRTSLPAGAGSVLSYYLRDENGAVRFSDNSAAQPSVFRKLALFVLDVAQRVCRLPE